MKIAIGSTNPAKVKAVESVLGVQYEVMPVEAPSNVSDQPFGDKETIKGAINRASNSLKTNKDLVFAIGLEGGVTETEYGLMVINWGAIVCHDGTSFVASGARAVLPEKVSTLVIQGKTLGEAMDIYTKRNGVSKKEGAMGIITNGRINRDEMFSHVVKALYGQYEFHYLGQ